MKTVMINGFSGCGKDTLVRNIGEQAPTRNWSIADWARYNVLDCIGETDISAKASEFVDDYRRTLIHLTNIAKYKSIVWDDLKARHAAAEKDGMSFFFVHCRDVGDFTAIKQRVTNTVSLWVSRDGIEPSNEQDAGAANYEYDIYFPLAPLNSIEYQNQINWLYAKLSEEE